MTRRSAVFHKQTTTGAVRPLGPTRERPIVSFVAFVAFGEEALGERVVGGF